MIRSHLENTLSLRVAICNLKFCPFNLLFQIKSGITGTPSSILKIASKKSVNSMRLLACLIVVLCFVGFANGQNINFKDIQLSNGYSLVETDHNRFGFTYRIKSKANSAVISQFRKVEFDTLLQLLDTTKIILSGDNQIVSSAASKSSSIHLFGSSVGELKAYFSNTQTKLNRVINLVPMGWERRLFSRVQAIPNRNSFLILYMPDKVSLILMSVDTEGNTQWTKKVALISKKVRLNNWAFTSETVHLVFTANYMQKKQTTEWRIFSLENGEEFPTIDLNKPGHKVAIDNLVGTSEHVYFIARDFRTKKITEKSVGQQVIYKVDNKRPNPTIQPIQASTGLPVLWMGIVNNNAGNPYLVGETFQSGSLGSYMGKGIATGILTMGLVSVTWNTMNFEKIAIMPLVEEASSNLKLITIEPRKIQLGTYLDPYSFAGYAYRTGQVRYFGNDSKGGIFLLDAPNMSYLKIGESSPIILGGLPDGFLQAIFVCNDYMISLNESKLKGNVEISVKQFKKEEK